MRVIRKKPAPDLIRGWKPVFLSEKIMRK